MRNRRDFSVLPGADPEALDGGGTVGGIVDQPALSAFQKLLSAQGLDQSLATMAAR